jgi:hypothetical protein
MQAPQLIEPSCEFLGAGGFAHSITFTYRPRLIEAGRKPVARFHACLRVVSRSRFQRHSVKLFSAGMIAIKRNGRSRCNGNSFNATAISLVEDFPANFLTTWPRLMIE